MENLNSRIFGKEEQKTHPINYQRRVQDVKVVDISTLKVMNRLSYYRNLVFNLAKPQRIIAKNFKEKKLVKVDQRTRNSWKSMLNISEPEAKQVFVAYHSKFVFDSIMKALNHKGINFKNVMHVSTCLDFFKDPKSIFYNEFVEADFEIESIRHFNHNRAILRVKTVLFDTVGNKSLEQFDDIFIKNLSKDDLKTIDAGNLSYENKEVFTNKHISSIDETNASYTEVIHLDKKAGKRYGNVSGDLNPLHTSQALAKVAGFKEPFIQGGFWANFMFYQASKQQKINHINVFMVKPSLLGQDFKLFIKDGVFEIKDEKEKVVCWGDFS